MYEEYPSIPAVAILKEAETDATLAEEKKNLGTADFASEHFTCGPCFVDDERTFWDELGNNIIDFKLGRLFRNPLGVWRDLKAVGARLKEKGDIQGNLVGEGAIRGGILVISPQSEVLYRYDEETGQEIPAAEIAAAVAKLAASVEASGVVVPTGAPAVAPAAAAEA